MNAADFQQLILSWQDPRVFLKYVWVEDLEHYGMTKFKPYPASIDLWKTYLQNRFVLVLKPRQIGISWTFASIYCWKMVTKAMSRTLIISKGDDEAKKFLSHVKFIFSNLLNGTPWEGQPPLNWRLDPDSTQTIGIQWDKSKNLCSEVIALPCTGTSGTSYTATDVFCDEWDKWRTTGTDVSIQSQSYSALKPTIDRTGGHLCGCSTSEILEPESFFKDLWRKSKIGENPFVPRFYDVTYHPLYSPEWFDAIKLEYSGRDYQRRQDYPVSEDEALTPPGEERIFPGADRLLDESRNYTWTQEKPWVHILYPFVSGWRYVAGADVASGHGQDYSVLTIIGQKGLDSAVCAVIRTKTHTTNEFASEIYNVCERYHFPLLSVERNAMGVSVVDDLVAMKYPRLYFKDENARKQNKPGITTGQSARQRGPSEEGEKWIWKLAKDINSGILKTHFVPMIEELRDFYWIDNKAQSRRGMNDDTVMSLAIANLLVGKSTGEAGFVRRGGQSETPTLVRT